MYDDYINYYGFPRELGFIRRKHMQGGGVGGVAAPTSALNAATHSSQLVLQPWDSSQVEARAAHDSCAGGGAAATTRPSA